MKDGVSFVGLGKAGKTVIARYIATGVLIENTKPTLGIDYIKVILNCIDLKFIDLPGQQKLRSVWLEERNVGICAIFVLDTSDVTHFIETNDELEKVLKSPYWKGVPLLFLFHKMDLPKAKEHLDEAKTFFNDKFIQQFGTRKVQYYETSIEDLKSLDKVKIDLEIILLEMGMNACT